MDILKQCQKWHENNEHHKIIEALEGILPRSALRKWTASLQGRTTIEADSQNAGRQSYAQKGHRSLETS